jgi:hypothetical protein
MKAYRGSICIAPLILIFGTRRRWVVIFSPSLFPQERGPGAQWIWGCLDPRDGLHFGWREKYLVCAGNGTKILRFSSSQQIKYTELPRDLFQYTDFITTLMYCTTVPFVLIVLRPFGPTLLRWEDFHWWIPSTSLKGCYVSPNQPISVYSPSFL